MKEINRFSGKYRYLSNFYICPVEYGNIIYPSSEHAFQSAKTLVKKKRVWVQEAASPSVAKIRGRSLKLRPNWEGLKRRVMYKIVLDKFFRNVDLGDKLLSTGDDILIESNYWGDWYWGVCNGVGKNHLGKILMRVREELQDANF